MNKLKESKALLEVWKWKDQCYREVAHLPLNAALARRMKDSKRTAESLPFQLPMAEPSRHLIVAESPAIYSVARGRTKRGTHIGVSP